MKICLSVLTVLFLVILADGLFYMAHTPIHAFRGEEDFPEMCNRNYVTSFMEDGKLHIVFFKIYDTGGSILIDLPVEHAKYYHLGDLYCYLPEELSPHGVTADSYVGTEIQFAMSGMSRWDKRGKAIMLPDSNAFLLKQDHDTIEWVTPYKMPKEFNILKAIVNVSTASMSPEPHVWDTKALLGAQYYVWSYLWTNHSITFYSVDSPEGQNLLDLARRS